MTASPYKFLNSYGIDDRNRSREAIVRPVGNEEVEPELVVRLLDDLVQTGLTVAGVPSPGDIEPAQLQIVCDTLWRAHGEGPLRLADYDTLADTDRDQSVARQLLDRRLVEEFERFQTRRELEVVRVLPRS